MDNENKRKIRFLNCQLSIINYPLAAALRGILLVPLFLAFGCASANYQGSAHGFNAFEDGKLQRV